MGAEPRYELPARRRHLAVDERGSGLRATWHPERGIVNLSVWRDDRCVETFWLSIGDAGRLATFLVAGLADAATLARGFGIDIQAHDFWRGSLDVLRRRIDQFEALASA